MAIDTDAILEEIKANQGKLNACARHEFLVPLDRNTKKPISNPALFCLWKCLKCGGYVDTSAKRWYEDGLAHGRVFQVDN